MVLQLLRDKNRMTSVFMEKLLIEPFISTDVKQLMSILQMCYVKCLAWSNGSVGGTFHMSSFTVAQPAPQRGALGIKETMYHIQVFRSQSLGDMLFMCYQRKTLHFCVPTKILKMI